MNHCPPRDVLERLLAETLPQAERQALEAHLSGCAACQELLTRLTSDDPIEGWARSRAERAESSPRDNYAFLERLARQGADPSATIDPPAGESPVGRGPDTEPAPPAPDTSGAGLPLVPGYELLEELGRGGMGIVYKARQLKLNRLVAMKMILGVGRAGGDDEARFRAEAEAVAGLQHPNIVQIHEIGEHVGGPYLCLEYVVGGSLAEHLAGRPQPPREAAAFLETVARAVQHAHAHGIVHRDLKPANVLLQKSEDRSQKAEGAAPSAFWLLSSDFSPKIADFGLAKRLDGDRTLPPRGGVVAGTPSYMPPEQAQGQEDSRGPTVDVYALGAILYELLTGRPPFRGDSPVDTLMQVVHNDPLPPRRLQPRLPADLETICLKCLNKEPRKRYASAQELADDLRRFLNGEAIRARPAGPLERAAKWARRRPAVAALLAAVVGLTVLGFALVTWQWRRAEAKAVAEQRAAAAIMIDRGSSLCEGGDVGPGLLAFARGLELAANAGDADLERLARVNINSWRSRLVRLRAAFRHRGPVTTVAYSPDGKTLVTGGVDGVVARWDVATGRPLGQVRLDGRVRSVAVGRGGEAVLIGVVAEDRRGGSSLVWEPAKEGAAPRVLRQGARVQTVAFSADGRRMLTVSPPEAQLWDADSGAPVGPPIAQGQVRTAAFSPDGGLLLTGSEDGTAQLWDALTAEARGQPLVSAGPVSAVALTAKGGTVAVAARSRLFDDRQQPFKLEWVGEVRLWTAGGNAGPTITLHGPVEALAFSPNGLTLATGTAVMEWRPLRHDQHSVGGEARLWDPVSGRALTRPLAHPSSVESLAFSPDGRRLLTGGEDGKARLFGTAAGEPLGAALPHEGEVSDVAFSPDGDTALTGSAGGDQITGAAARLWELPAARDHEPILPHGQPVMTLAFSPDGRSLLTGSWLNTSVRRWDLASAPPRELEPAFSAGDGVRQVAYSADGRLVVACVKGAVRLWNAADGAPRDCRVADDANSAAFSPDGGTLLVSARDRTVRFWDVAAARADGDPIRHEGVIPLVAYTPAGDAVWLESEEAAVRFWRRQPGGRPELLWQQDGHVSTAALSPDGGTLLTIEKDWHLLRFRDAHTGRPRAPSLPPQAARLFSVAYSLDGAIAVSCDWDGKAHLWDTATGRPLGVPLPHGKLVFAAAFRPGARQGAGRGRLLATASEDEAVHLWEVPTPVEGTPEAVRRAIERDTGLELDLQGTVRERPRAAADLPE